ncbi:MAG: sulfurtransferase-like selenium metabolism protein YedF [Syntrophomonadaceae bacterium]|nr:sulfurtransferase-like selenium metabolism protein YedF [Syntrophomonadaceae bacterium]
MSNIVDARNLSCPEPVIMTKKAMDNNPDIDLITIVSEKVAQENVTKLATSQGYQVEVEEKEDGIYLYLKKSDAMVESAQDDVAILVTNQFFGQGNEEIGQLLMKNFLYTLTEVGSSIKNIIFMNSGVYLTCEGSPALEHLKALEDSGVEILCCGTCLDFFKIKDILAVGNITNMYTAMEILTSASKNITL